MAAASESVVFSIESAILFAAQDILINVGGFPTALVRLDGDYDDLPDECLLLRFVDGGMTGLGAEYRGATGWHAQATEYIRGTGTLTVAYRMLKESNTTSSVTGLYRVIDEKAGLIRSLFSKHRRLFTIGRLPYHAVIDILRLAPSRGVDNTAERECLVLEEKFQLTYEILPSAWPALT